MNNIIKRVWNQNRMVNIEGLSGAAFQAEDGGHTFQISGIDDTGATVSLSGTVAGVFRRPDNADIALTGSASGGVASVTLTDDCYAVPGRFGLTIFVTSGGQKTAVYACIGTVANTSGGAVAGETPQDVVDLINDIAAAVATIPASYTDLMAAIAPTYSNEAVYAVGSYAWYNGILYRCKNTITTAESWTAAHWTAAVLTEDWNDLRNILGSTTGNLLPDYNADSWTSPTSVSITRNGYALIINGTKENSGAVTITDQFVLGAGSYEFGVCDEDSLVGTGAYIQLFADGDVISQTQTHTPVTVPSATNATFRILLGAGSSFTNLSVKPMLFYGSLPSTYIPQVSAHDYVARNNVGEAMSSISNLSNATAQAYSTSATYSVGDYVWHDGTLYRCTTAITTAESWTAAHWTAAVLGDDVGDLRNAVNAIMDSDYFSFFDLAWENGTLDNNGAEIADPGTNKRYRTQFIHAPLSQDIVLSMPRYINVYGYRYDCDKNFIGFVTGGWLGASSDNQDGIVKITNDGTAFYRFVMRAKTSYTGSDRAITTRDTNNSVAFIETKADVSNKAEAINFTVGSIVDYYNLTNSDISNRAVCSFIPVRGVCALFTIPSGHQAYVYQYDSSYQYLQENGWSSGHFARGLNDACKFLRLVIKTDDGSSAPTLSTLKNGVSIVFKDDIERVNINPIITGNALLAHRGYAVTAPENTIPAIELAAENGYKMVEVDLQFTSDGVCVLLHDNTIDRTSNGTGNIFDMTYAQALEYDFGSWKSAEYAGTKIPTLKEALLCCKYYGMCAQLDIADTNKTNITEANLQTMIDVIMECGMQGNVNICAENDRARAVSYLKQGLIICIGVGDTEGKFNARKDIAKMCSLLIGSNSTGTATEAMLKRCHDNYMPYQIWTVDVANTAKDYFRAGYDWIITNSLKPSDLT